MIQHVNVDLPDFFRRARREGQPRVVEIDRENSLEALIWDCCNPGWDRLYEILGELDEEMHRCLTDHQGKSMRSFSMVFREALAAHASSARTQRADQVGRQTVSVAGGKVHDTCNLLSVNISVSSWPLAFQRTITPSTIKRKGGDKDEGNVEAAAANTDLLGLTQKLGSVLFVSILSLCAKIRESIQKCDNRAVLAPHLFTF